MPGPLVAQLLQTDPIAAKGRLLALKDPARLEQVASELFSELCERLACTLREWHDPHPAEIRWPETDDKHHDLHEAVLQLQTMGILPTKELCEAVLDNTHTAVCLLNHCARCPFKTERVDILVKLAHMVLSDVIAPSKQ